MSMAKRMARLVILLILLLQWPAFAQRAIESGLQSLPGPLPKIDGKDPCVEYDLDLAKEKFFISIPQKHSDSDPYGLLVFMSPSDASAAIPPGWSAILDAKRLVFMSPQNAGNEQPVARRAGLAIVGTRKLLEMANIATNRIYIGGLSGGARIASYVSFVHPGLFAGVFAVCGVNFARKVDRVQSTRADDYGWFNIDESRAQATKQRVRFVLVTGPGDFRHGNILDIYNGGFVKDGYDVKLIDVPGMGHSICTPGVLDEGLTFLDIKR